MAKEELKVAGLTLLVEGGAQFASDLNTAKQTSKSLSAELKLLESSTTSAGKNGTEYLRAKTELLTANLEKQQQITKITKIALDEAASAAEVDAKQVEKLQNEVLKSQIAENKLNTAINEANAALAKSENAALQAGIAQKKLGEEVNKTGEKLASSGKKMSMYLSAPIAAAAVASVKLASDYQESLNKVDVAFGKDSEEIIKWSQTTLKNLGLAKGTAMDMAATYGDMATGMGFATDTAAKMGEEIVGRAADLASFKNISIDIANTAMTSIFTGETESLKKLGVVMTEVNLENYALSNGYEKTYKEMSQQEKIQLRLNYVMDATKNSSGDFARTSGGAANQSRLFTESLKELGETFGEEMLPAITPAIKEVNKLIQSFGDLDEGQKKVVIGVALAVASLGPLLTTVGKGIALYGSLNTALGAHKIAVATSTVATEGLAAAEGEAAVAGAGLSVAIAPIIAIAGALAIAGIAYEAITAKSREATNAVLETTAAINSNTDAYEKSVGEIDTSASATNAMLTKLEALAGVENKSNAQKAEMQALVSALNQSVEGLNLTYDAQTDSLSKNKDAIEAVIQAKYDQLKMQAYESRISQAYEDQITLQDEYTAALDRYTKAKKAVESSSLKNSFQGLADYTEFNSAATALISVADAYDKTTKSLGDTQDAYAALAETSQTATGTIADSSTDAATTTTAAVSTITEEFQKQLDAAKDAQQEYYDSMTSATQEYYKILDDINSYGIKQNDLSAEEWQKNYQKRIADMESWRANMTSLASKVPAEFLSYLASLGPSQAQMIQDLVNATPAELESYIQTWRDGNAEAAQVAADLSDALYRAYGDPYSTWYTLGKSSIDGLIAGMKNNIPGAYTAATEAAKGVANYYKKQNDQHSPSRVMEKIGANDIKGLIVGFKSQESDLKRQASKMAQISSGSLLGVPAASLGSQATNQALGAMSSVSTTTQNYTTVDSSTPISFAGATFNVRSDNDIKAIAAQLALMVGAQRKAAGT